MVKVVSGFETIDTEVGWWVWERFFVGLCYPTVVYWRTTVQWYWALNERNTERT